MLKHRPPQPDKMRLFPRQSGRPSPGPSLPSSQSQQHSWALPFQGTPHPLLSAWRFWQFWCTGSGTPHSSSPSSPSTNPSEVAASWWHPLAWVCLLLLLLLVLAWWELVQPSLPLDHHPSSSRRPPAQHRLPHLHCLLPVETLPLRRLRSPRSSLPSVHHQHLHLHHHPLRRRLAPHLCRQTLQWSLARHHPLAEHSPLGEGPGQRHPKLFCALHQ
mmetsp:Transcript_44428/g.105252  ORF Transcript_44428/g.105252 Transcript_44428/m.105252 type:complete len:216 (+) Transcript_44428:1654-2301(+)